MERQGRKIKRITMVNVDGVSVIQVGENGVEKIKPNWINISPDSEVGVYRAYDKRGLLVREIHASIPMDIEYVDGDESDDSVIRSFMYNRGVMRIGDIDKVIKIETNDLYHSYEDFCTKRGYNTCTYGNFMAEMMKENYAVTMTEGVEYFNVYNIL